ncbi:ISAs1 family transposase [Xenorhabdus sp. Reich]|uniref:ISAs1 family transposase n=1 Tax=Xenorhabdus littoralis TaxID=2582835 RepID=A0ABU4SHM0_9GAMM|nr:ISAs1 family transposase [Xenorhabdus sp. Reich]MDX7998155.1 ISAs1 family transposase [Xenorhabdus sp. Reich]
MIIDVFSQYFGELQNPRQSAKISYPLFDVLFLTMCAVIAGAEGWEDIEDFGETHLDWLQKKKLFPMGLPVHDTIARIISRLDPTQFQHCFICWAQAVLERIKSGVSISAIAREFSTTRQTILRVKVANLDLSV